MLSQHNLGMIHKLHFVQHVLFLLALAHAEAYHVSVCHTL